MTYQFIADQQGSTSVKGMCQALGVSESGYYAWKRRPPSRHSQEDRLLAEQIEQIYRTSRKTYGSPRIQAELCAQGQRSSRKRIARLMRQGGISAQRKRHRTCTTDSHHALPVAPNRLNREFRAERPNEKWVTDITGVWTSQGWLYLGAVLDVFSRKVIGWAVAQRREDDLVIAALRMALQARRPQAGLLHHSDRGSQYTSRDYQALLQAWGIEVSMSRKGDCYDNAGTRELLCHLEGRVYRSAAVGQPQPGTASDF